MKKLKLLLFITLFYCFGVLLAQPAKAFIDENNVYIAFVDGTQKKLTFNKSDKNPVLLKDENKVFFVRSVNEYSGYRKYLRYKIMMVDINTLMETVITEKKPYKDGNDNTHEILNVIDLTLSLDSKSIYFVTEKYASSNQLVKVNIISKQWTELFATENFELVKKGAFKGHFLIEKSEIRERGRDIYYKLCNELGEVVKDFDSEESFIEFKSQI